MMQIQIQDKGRADGDLPVVLAHKLAREQQRLYLISWLLLASLIGLVLLMGWIVAGWMGALWSGGLALGTMVIGRKIPVEMLMKLHGGQKINAGQAPEMVQVLEVLSRRAGLKRRPDLYYLPRNVANAFTIGNHNHSGVAVSDLMFKLLHPREMIGVLAHEVAHLKHGDVSLMGQAESMLQLLRVMCLMASGFLLLQYPLLTQAGIAFPWLTLVALLALPVVGRLLQLSLSRTREFAADLGAVSLTGDALGLASALKKIDDLSLSWWQRLMGVKPSPEGDLWRTHPLTEKRIQRLRSIAAQHRPLPMMHRLDSLTG